MKYYKITKEIFQTKGEPTFLFNIYFGDLCFTCMNKKYINKIRTIIFDAKYAKEYQRRHTEDVDVSTHSTEKAFLVLMCEDKLSDG